MGSDQNSEAYIDFFLICYPTWLIAGTFPTFERKSFNDNVSCNCKQCFGNIINPAIESDWLWADSYIFYYNNTKWQGRRKWQ